MSGRGRESSPEFPDALADAGFSMPDYPSPPRAPHAGLSNGMFVESNADATSLQLTDYAIPAPNPPELATGMPIQQNGTADSSSSPNFARYNSPSLLSVSIMSVEEVFNGAGIGRLHADLRLGSASETARARHDASPVMSSRCACGDPSTCINNFNLEQLVAPPPISVRIAEWLENLSPTRNLISRLQLPPNGNRFHGNEAAGKQHPANLSESPD